MKRFFKSIGLVLIIAIVANPSCSDDETQDFTVQTILEHTFHLEPKLEAFGIGARMTHILDISSNPDWMKYRDKIHSIYIDSIGYSFSIPGDKQVYEVYHSTVTACPYVPLESETWTTGDCWETSYVTPDNYENFLNFRDGLNGSVLIGTRGALGRSLVNYQKLFTKVIFYFEDTNQGYPIDHFDFTMKFYVSLREQDDGGPY